MTTATKTMSVQQALRELSLTATKVQDTLRRTSFVQVVPANHTTVSGKTITDFNNKANENWQSINALLTYHSRIKEAITQSNAVTKVEIGGYTYTVAEAIARKEEVKLDKILLGFLNTEITTSKGEAQKMERELNLAAEKAAAGLYVDKAAGSAGDYQKYVDGYVSTRRPVIVGLADAEAKAEDLQDKIDTFLSEVDWKLTESNVRTTITIAV